MSPISIEANVTVPMRSRLFTEDDARKVLTLLQGVEAVPAHKDEDGQDVPATEAVEPSKKVAYGSFDTAGAARSAGVTLNKFLRSLGADHNYATTTFVRDEKYVGVILNKPARTESENGDAPAAEPTPPARRRQRQRGRR